MSATPAAKDPLALPFDQYQRYRLVADLLTHLRAGGPALEVLDVGGRTAVLRDFLPGERIRLVDMEASDATGLILGDGSALPFADKSFDVVAAFDTLEHVPVARREAFVAECARVAKRWVVLCGPYQHERVVAAEELLQQFLKEKLGERHRYLDEHRSHGLPERARVEAQFASLGARVHSIGHANLDRWLVLQCLSMYMDYDAVLRPLAREFQRFYNRSLYASDHAEPVYRHALIAAFDGAALPTAADLLGPPRAPAGALVPFQALAAELVAFDRDREAWRAERDVLRNQSVELKEDLAGHRVTLAELAAELSAQRQVIEEQRTLLERERAGARETIATLERDLAGHKAQLAELESQLDGERQFGRNAMRDRDALAALRAEHEGVVRDMRADLDGHRAALANSAADLEGHRAALSELQALFAQTHAVLEAVNLDLNGHRAALEDTRAELERMQLAFAAANRATELVRAEFANERARASLLDEELRESLALATGLEKSLADREVVYDQLRAELRSRWRNLLRVFRP